MFIFVYPGTFCLYPPSVFMSVLSTLCPNVHMFYGACVLPVIKGSDLEEQRLQTYHWLLYQMYIFLILIFLEKNIHPNIALSTLIPCVNYPVYSLTAIYTPMTPKFLLPAQASLMCSDLHIHLHTFRFYSDV